MTALYPSRRRLAAIQGIRAVLLWALALTVILVWPVRAQTREVTLGDCFYLIDLLAWPQQDGRS